MKRQTEFYKKKDEIKLEAYLQIKLLYRKEEGEDNLWRL